VEGPEEPIRKMYFRAPDRGGEATHLFPRGERGGVILGGCRQKDDWNGEADLEFAEDIKRRCCALVPQLGRPEDLKVVKHGVGLRRKQCTLVILILILIISELTSVCTSWQRRWCSN
jgi:D-amino-acid oxidase